MKKFYFVFKKAKREREGRIFILQQSYTISPLANGRQAIFA